MRVPLGYKFIIGFIVVVAASAFIPDFVEHLDLGEASWIKRPLGFLAAMVIGLILGTSFTKSFTRRFGLLTDMAKRIQSGDLSESGAESIKKSAFADETAELEEALKAMAENLRTLVEQIKSTVEKLAEAQGAFGAVIQKGDETSKEVISGTSGIFDGALEQANHIGELSSTVKEMANLADDVAKKVTDSANASQKVNSMVQRGATTATSAMEKLETIFKGIENTENAAVRLKEKINDIPKILDVITHISRQTDLLALNATIEASKAGEHGRGFALVADEVRRFADNTNNSVEDVSTVVKELKKEVESVVALASEGTAFLRGGRDDVRKIREILADITNYTSDVAERSTLILGLTRDQKERAAKSASAIEEVSRIARDNLSTTERVDDAVERHGAVISDTLVASQKLSDLASELKAATERFTLDR